MEQTHISYSVIDSRTPLLAQFHKIVTLSPIDNRICVIFCSRNPMNHTNKNVRRRTISFVVCPPKESFVDEILNECGSFGRYQFRLLSAFAFICFIVSMHYYAQTIIAVGWSHWYINSYLVLSRVVRY